MLFVRVLNKYEARRGLAYLSGELKYPVVLGLTARGLNVVTFSLPACVTSSFI